MGVHLMRYVGCSDSHVCTLRDSHGCTLRRDVWIAMGVHLGCYEGCVDSHAHVHIHVCVLSHHLLLVHRIPGHQEAQRSHHHHYHPPSRFPHSPPLKPLHHRYLPSWIHHRPKAQLPFLVLRFLAIASVIVVAVVVYSIIMHHCRYSHL